MSNINKEKTQDLRKEWMFAPMVFPRYAERIRDPMLLSGSILKTPEFHETVAYN